MAFLHQHLDGFKELFKGNMDAYGRHVPDNPPEGKKVKGKFSTESGPLTEQQYLKHLHGKEGLGIIPVDAEGNVWFAAIDIDKYPINEKYYLDIVGRSDLPFVLCKSKSGGIHAYIFFKEAVSAAKLLKLLKVVLQLFGLKQDNEIFPKQTSLSDKAKGNWINLPYFGYENTNRYAISTESHETLNLAEFIDYANSKRTTLKGLETAINNVALSEGPPCLQAICLAGGLSEGARNRYLFNLCVYAKARYKDEFDEKVHAFNRLMDRPLDYVEVDQTVISSHNKRDYTYKCKGDVLEDFCNRNLCMKRKFGIGSGSISDLNFGQMTKYNYSEPYYTWEINGTELRFENASDVLNQRAFRLECMNQLHHVPNLMKDNEWIDKVNKALSTMTVVEADNYDDGSIDSIWVSMVTEYFSRPKAMRPDQLHDGQVFYQERTGKLHFRQPELIKFLDNSGYFREFDTKRHERMLRTIGAERGRVNFNGTTIRTRAIDLKKAHKKELFLDVNMDESTPEEFESIVFNKGTDY